MPAPDTAVVTVKVPFMIRKRGGRKLVLVPEGAPAPPLAPQVDSTLVKAIARAFRRQKMLETGRYAMIREIAKAEKIESSYVSRVLRLTLLAPAIVDAAVDNRLTLRLMFRLPYWRGRSHEPGVTRSSPTAIASLR
jgi:hypothetical protein